MGGIVGIVSLGEEPNDVAALQRMNDLQAHRACSCSKIYPVWEIGFPMKIATADF